MTHFTEYENIKIDDNTVSFVREYSIVSCLYGSDADGSRGLPEVLIEDDVALDIAVWDDLNDMWVDLDTFNCLEQDRIVNSIYKWMDQNEPEVTYGSI